MQKAASARLAEVFEIGYFDLYFRSFSTYMRAIRNLGAKVVKKNQICKYFLKIMKIIPLLRRK